MGPLWKCCVRSLKENKRRTIVTILGVLLATALITAVSCIETSFLKSNGEYLRKDADWHAKFLGVSAEDIKYFENNQSIEDFWIVRRKGYGWIQKDGFENNYLEILAPEKDFYEHQNIVLVKGRMPEKDGEIVIAKDIRKNEKNVINLGDEIKVAIGDRSLGEKLLELGSDGQEGESLLIREEKTYKVVGFVRDAASSMAFGRGSGASRYVSKTYVWDNGTSAYLDVYVRYTKKGLRNHAEVEQGLLGISKELYNQVFTTERSRSPYREEIREATKRIKDFYFNSELAMMEDPFMMKDFIYVAFATCGMIYLVIVYAGVFTINNSFDLSFTERVRFYGMLACVGTTKRQKRLIVWMEALSIAVIGIPLGIIMGCALTGGLILIINAAISILARNMGFHMVFQASLPGILIAALVSLLMVFLSAMESAVRASKIMPITAIRLNDVIKPEGKKSRKKGEKRKKTPRLIHKLFGVGGGVAWQNYQRARLKYRASVSSIAVSVAMLIGLCFVKTMFDATASTLKTAGWDWQLELVSTAENAFEEIKKLAESPNVTQSIIHNFTYLRAEEGGLNLLPGKEYDGAIILSAIDDASFEKLLKEANVDPKKAKGKALVDANVEKWKLENGNHSASYQEKVAEFHDGDEMIATRYVKDRSTQEVRLEIAGEVSENSKMDYWGSSCIMVYVDWAFYENHRELFDGRINAYFLCEDSIALEEAIEKSNLIDYTVINNDLEYRSHRFTEVLVLSLVGGFICIIIFIGATNVINAVSTNMELRASEYAKLKALGMTDRQFRGMLRMEGFLVAGKGIAYGLVIGCGISYAMSRFFWEANDKSFNFAYKLPILESLIVIFVIAILMDFVLRYCRKRFEKKNLIETIRGENV